MFNRFTPNAIGAGAAPGAANSSGFFGSNVAPAASPFGSAPSPTPFGTALPASTAPASVGISTPYAITNEFENNVSVKMLSITAMPAYRHLCHEEIRVDDYGRGRKGPSSFPQTSSIAPSAVATASTSAFGARPAYGSTGAFGSSSVGGSTTSAIPTSTSPFGTPSTFGASKPLGLSSGPGSFGQPFGSSPSNAPSSFGSFGSQQSQPQPSQPSSFGSNFSSFGSTGTLNQQPSTLSFMSTSQQPLQQQPSAFGSFGASNAGPSAFGSSAFGQPQPQQQQQSTASNLFGGSASSTGSSLFGSRPSGSGLFGQPPQQQAPQQQQQPSAFGFGSSSNSGPAGSSFGGFAGGTPMPSSMSSQPQQQQPTSSSGGLFGAPQSAFGSAGLGASGSGQSGFGASGSGGFSFAPSNPQFPAPSTSITTSSGSLFSTPSATNTSSLFGALPSSTSALGTSNTANSGFGSTGPSNLTSSFGLFGASRPQASTGFSTPFTGGGASNSSAATTASSGFFGQTSSMPTALPSTGQSLFPAMNANTTANTAASSLSLAPPLSAIYSKAPAVSAKTATEAAMPKSPVKFTPRTSFRIRPRSLDSQLISIPAINFSQGGETSSTSTTLMPRKSANSLKKLVVADLDDFKTGESQGRPVESHRASSFAGTPSASTSTTAGDFLTSSMPFGQLYTLPPVKALEALKPGERAAIKNFIIGKKGVGQIRFLAPVDLTAVDLDRIFELLVLFNDGEALLYPDPMALPKPEPGLGLNVPAELRLERIWTLSRNSRQPILDANSEKVALFREKLKNVEGTNFVSYDPATGTWIFTVSHF